MKRLTFWTRNKAVLAITLLGLSTPSFSNPTTTPRIFSSSINESTTPLPNFEVPGATNTVALALDTKSATDIKESISSEISAIGKIIETENSPEKLANLKLKEEHLNFLSECLTNYDDNKDAATQILSCVSTTLSVDGVQLKSDVSLQKTIGEYEDKASEDYRIGSAYINAIITDLSSALQESLNAAVISVLVEKKRSLEVNHEFNLLLENLSTSGTSVGRQEAIRVFFKKYFNLSSIDIKDKDTSDVNAAINLAQQLYKNANAAKSDIWKEGQHFKFNHLTYTSNLSKEKLATFGGINIGAAASNQTIKINALEYDIYWSDTWRSPITLYSAEVIESSEAEQDDVSRTKLLDTEMGTLNLAFSNITKFRIGEICRFSNAFGCYLPIQAGVRALKLPEINEITTESEGQPATTETKDNYSFGGYFRAGINVVFPITPRNDNSSVAGRLAISANYAFYHQSGTDLEKIFPEFKDAEGNPAFKGSSYEAINLNLLFTITNTITIAAKHFKGTGDGDPLDSITSFEFSYTPK